MPRGRPFGGEVTDVLWRTLHPSAAFVGAVCGVLLAFAVVVPARLGAAPLAPILAQALLSLFVAKVAVDGRQGGGQGSLLGGAVGWSPAFDVLGRLVTLNLLWAIPVALAGETLGSVPAALLTGAVTPSATFLVLAMALLPPLFLLVSVGADSFSGIFEARLWREVSLRRAPETVMLYVVYLGGLMTSSAVSLLLAAGIGAGRARFTIFLLLAAGSYTLGITVLLLGRLVGAYLRTEGSGVAASLPEPTPRLTGRARPPRSASFEQHLDDLISGAIPPVTATSDPAEAVSAAAESERLLTRAPRARRSQPVRTENPIPAAGSGPVDLSQLREDYSESLSARLRANERTAREDPSAALAEMEQLLTERGPHPLVLTRLAVLEDELGSPDAIETALRAARAAQAVNNFGVLADLFEHFAEGLEDVSLDLSTRTHMAGSLAARHRFEAAVSLYRTVLSESPDHLPAIKGLIQIADQYLKSTDRLAEAITIYDALDKLCPEHPFEDFVDRGRDSAERRLARSH